MGRGGFQLAPAGLARPGGPVTLQGLWRLPVSAAGPGPARGPRHHFEPHLERLLNSAQNSGPFIKCKHIYLSYGVLLVLATGCCQGSVPAAATVTVGSRWRVLEGPRWVDRPPLDQQGRVAQGLVGHLQPAEDGPAATRILKPPRLRLSFRISSN